MNDKIKSWQFPANILTGLSRNSYLLFGQKITAFLTSAVFSLA